MPLSPGRIAPRDMNDRQWATFVSQSGIQADRRVKTFTPTYPASEFSGADPVGDLSYFNFGKIVFLWNDNGADMTGESSATTFTINSLPAEITPSTTTSHLTLVMDNNAGAHGTVSVTSTGTLAFGLGTVSGTKLLSGGAFTTGVGVLKGLPTGWFLVYPLL